MNQGAPFLARLLSVLTVVACAYGVLFFSKYSIQKARVVGLEELEAAVLAGELSTGEEALKLTTQLSRFTDPIPLPPLKPHIKEDWDRVVPRIELKLRATRELNSFGESSEALNQFLFSLPANERSELSETLRGLSAARKSLSEEEGRIISGKKTEELTWSKLDLLYRDFRAVIGLRDYGEEVTLEDLELYPEGILEGLPKIPEFSEEVATSADLKRELGKLDTPLPKLKPEEFQRKLKALRSSVAASISELDWVDENREEATRNIEEARQQEKRLFAQAKAAISSSIQRDISLINQL